MYMKSNIFFNINRLLSALFVALVYLSPALAYEPHLGIPAPWVDPDVTAPSAPSNWSQEIPGYYYVNYQSGSDSRTFGTPGSPRQTLPNPIPAGSYVAVAGTYSHRIGGLIRVAGNGTSANWTAGASGPVWIVGANGNRAEFTNYKMVVIGSYIYFDNIYVHSGSRFQVGSYVNGETADHILLRNSEVQGLPTDGTGAIVATVGSSSDLVDNVIIYNSELHDTGNLQSPTDDDAGIMVISQYSSYVWVLNNTMYTASGSGLQINPTSNPSSTHHIFVSQNHVYNVRQSALWVKYATDVVFAENVVHDIITTSWSPSKGLGAQYEPQRFWMVNNTVYNVEYGIRVASTNAGQDWNIYMIGNLIYDAHAPSPSSHTGSAWDEACIHLHGGVNRYIYNNTLVNCDAGINLSSTIGNFYIKNNIISNITASTGQHLFVEYQKNSTTVDNNIFYQNGSNIRIKWGSILYDLASFKSSTSQCSNNCSSANPQFVSPASDIFNVATGAPSLDTGSTDNIFSTFQNLYGVSIDKDIDQNPRFQGASIDIGAFEQQTGVIVRPPPSPPLLND
jgi:hypothetical protein